MRYRVKKAIANSPSWSYLSRIGKDNFSSVGIQKIGEYQILPVKIKLFEQISKFSTFNQLIASNIDELLFPSIECELLLGDRCICANTEVILISV